MMLRRMRVHWLTTDLAYPAITEVHPTMTHMLSVDFTPLCASRPARIDIKLTTFPSSSSSSYFLSVCWQGESDGCFNEINWFVAALANELKSFAEHLLVLPLMLTLFKLTGPE